MIIGNLESTTETIRRSTARTRYSTRWSFSSKATRQPSTEKINVDQVLESSNQQSMEGEDNSKFEESVSVSPTPKLKIPSTILPLTTRRIIFKTNTPSIWEKTSTGESYTRKSVQDDYAVTKIVETIPEHSKVLIHSSGAIQCLDQGNFPHPVSCKKFISCAKMETGKVIGWEYTCPKNLSFDPIGGMCNWSADLGCDE